jgi:aspartyl-tRNA(Asn)/glutamyl-tRNA(Gln) amidotransferase subunit A
MAAVDVVNLSIIEASRLLRTKQLSPVELTQSYFSRIDSYNPKVNAFITVLREEALATAREAEKEIAAGKYRGPLHGIPIAVKDIFATHGHLTTCGSKILKDNMTHYDATAVARLRKAGCILLGKLTMSEFALGDDVNPLTGQRPTRNPWNLERSVSGSSSGSGAAVAASFCAAALGTDTGGSIRLPAGYCGIVGMKPTYGRVSRYGVTPLAWSLDNAGPMSKFVEDNALLLGVIAGADAADDMCSTRPVPDYRAKLRAGVKGLRIGLPKNYFFEYSTADVADAVREAAHTLEKLGATVSEVDLPHLKYTVGAEMAIIFGEPLAYHSKYIRQGKFDLYTDLNKAQWDTARYISSEDYIQAQRVRRYMVRDFEKAYQQVDVIFAPSNGIEANLVQEDLLTDTVPVRQVPAGSITIWEILWRMPSPANLAGVPAFAMPCGFSASGLPLGMQIMGRHFEETTVYQVAAAYEGATEWHKRRPEFLGKA